MVSNQLFGCSPPGNTQRLVGTEGIIDNRGIATATLRFSMTRFFKFLPGEQRQAFLEVTCPPETSPLKM